MEKLISNRFYLDYNATSPLANSVRELLAKGDFPFGNPSSIHSTGKKAFSYLRKAELGILDLFSCAQDYAVLFHSGATEGINTFIKGVAETFRDQGQIVHFFSSPTDHPAVHSLIEYLQHNGHKAYSLQIDSLGQLDWNYLEGRLEQFSSEPVVLNYTWVNNETGVVNSLEHLVTLKQRYPNVIIHVDAVQSPGKVRDWQTLCPAADVYTFSGHKFGALKGCGFSLYKRQLQFSPLLHGGGQQLGMRSGTINVLGAYTQYIALQELVTLFNSDEMEKGIIYTRDALRSLLGDKGELIADGGNTALNTVSFIIHGKKADILLAACDMGGIELSAGSACSAGVLHPNRVLMAMGLSAEASQSYLRLSYGPDLTVDLAREVVTKLSTILQRFL